jgi:hypothetical protein
MNVPVVDVTAARTAGEGWACAVIRDAVTQTPASGWPRPPRTIPESPPRRAAVAKVAISAPLRTSPLIASERPAARGMPNRGGSRTGYDGRGGGQGSE